MVAVPNINFWAQSGPKHNSPIIIFLKIRIFWKSKVKILKKNVIVFKWYIMSFYIKQTRLNLFFFFFFLLNYYLVQDSLSRAHFFSFVSLLTFLVQRWGLGEAYRLIFLSVSLIYSKASSPVPADLSHQLHHTFHKYLHFVKQKILNNMTSNIPRILKYLEYIWEWF